MGRVLRESRAIVLADNTEIEVHPLTIRQLRKFMKAVDGLNATAESLSDEDITKMMEAAAIALEKSHPELAKDVDALEDKLDLRSFNALLSAAMGTDPNE